MRTFFENSVKFTRMLKKLKNSFIKSPESRDLALVGAVSAGEQRSVGVDVRTVKPQLYIKIKQSAGLKYIEVNTYCGTTFLQ